MTGRILLVVGCLLAFSASASARPAHKKAIADHLGPFLSKKLNACTLCHLPDAKEEEGEKPHNPFGSRLAAVRKELQKAGKKTDIPSRLEAIADEDSDGDGSSNLLELLAGHNPGDGKDKASDAEFAAAAKALVALRERLKEYRWRPFEPVVRPAIPEVKNKAWVRTPVDAFLAAEHERRGLTPRPEASRPILIRRISLDLTGLPPTPEEVSDFVDDTSPDAYEKLVERLLASPHYGERWGRHWMDVWRYSDWAGYGNEVRDSQPHIWRWRDWIVESLNADKPYDRMVQEMLAGDEIAPADQNVLRATGFLVRNWYKFNRDTWLERTVEHTSKAFLGVTLNCARCHDHFFDPISQEEYYRFRAFFEPHDIRVDKVGKDGLVRVIDAKLEAPTYLYVRGVEANPDKKNPLRPGILSCLNLPMPAIEPIAQPAKSTGRRLALSKWIVDKQNPLTARVAVNHVWLRHFGAALVPSVFDFGANGQAATHPALLDWLAAEFMAPTTPGGETWSMKHLHRLIVLSAAYRMESSTDPTNVAKDGDNVGYWRANVRRMEAEIVRDSVLAIGGQLDRKFGGPEIDHKLGLTTPRRSIYYRHAPEKTMEFLSVFDSANVVECYQRTESVIPQQALALANSSLVMAQSRIVARSFDPKLTPAAFVDAGFQKILGRSPSSQERTACEQFLNEQSALLANPKTLTPFAGKTADQVPPSPDPQLRARENLIHVLFNHSDFVTIR